MLSILAYADGASVGDAIANEIRRLGSNDNRVLVGKTIEVPSGLADVVMPQGGYPGHKTKDIYADMAKALVSLDAITPLIVNALLYIDTCRSHIRKGWPEGAPDKIAARALTAPKGATKARDTLLRANWREAHLCTLDAEIEAGAVVGNPNPDADRLGRRTHWRRGHWRMQVHGPANSLRKRMRIRATIVGRTPGAPAEDRKYRVGAASADKRG